MDNLTPEKKLAPIDNANPTPENGAILVNQQPQPQAQVPVIPMAESVDKNQQTVPVVPQPTEQIPAQNQPTDTNTNQQIPLNQTGGISPEGLAITLGENPNGKKVYDAIIDINRRQAA